MSHLLRTSIPILIVVVEDGHEPHAPSSRSRTTSPSISMTDTLPPSAMRYGRTSSSTVSTFSSVSSRSSSPPAVAAADAPGPFLLLLRPPQPMAFILRGVPIRATRRPDDPAITTALERDEQAACARTEAAIGLLLSLSPSLSLSLSLSLRLSLFLSVIQIIQIIEQMYNCTIYIYISIQKR